MPNTFGERLEMLMSERQLNQVQLADALGIKKQSINSYVKGKSRPELDVLMRFADYFDCSIDFLLGREDFRSHERMKAYDQMIEENFRDSLDCLGLDKREYYLESITQLTRSYRTTEGKGYSMEQFELTVGLIEQTTEITELIAKIDRDTAKSRQIMYSVGQGKTITVDSRSAECILVLRHQLQTAMDEAHKAIKSLGDIGFATLEKCFPQTFAVLNSPREHSKQVAESLCHKFSALSLDEPHKG